MTVGHDGGLEFSLYPQLLGKEGKYWKLCYQSIISPFKTALFVGCEHVPGGFSVGLHKVGAPGPRTLLAIVLCAYEHLLPLCFLYLKEKNPLSASIRPGSQFHGYWICTPDLWSWYWGLTLRKPTLTTTTPGQCANWTAWLHNQLMSVEYWETDWVKRIPPYQNGCLYSKEIVYFPIQRHKGRMGW